MLEHCLVLNGPPGSGKDTIAEELTKLRSPSFHKHQFKDQLYIDTAVYFDISVDAFVDRAMDRELKEVPWYRLPVWTPNSLTPKMLSAREALIKVSEEIIKPHRGEDYYGQSAAKACLRANSKYAVFSDGGFAREIDPLKEIYKKLTVVRLYRNGFHFHNDSRNYIENHDDTIDLHLIPGDPVAAAKTILFETGLFQLWKAA